MRESLVTPHGRLQFPSFLPDATYGAVKAVDSRDLAEAGVRALVMNAYHLMQKPGSSTVSALGGVHGMSGWDMPIMTDSGGFQAYSVIKANPSSGSIGRDGITLIPEGAKRKFTLTPEKSIQLQLSYGSDILVCLDECTHPDDSREAQVSALKKTIDWAERCKAEFARLLGQKRPGSPIPLLFAVVQGGNHADLRTECARELAAIGFDGMGFGGWPLDSEGSLMEGTLRTVREALPDDIPLHALGIGHPEYVVRCWNMGYDTFDCSMPTRDARRGRLYSSREPLKEANFTGRWLKFEYMQDERHVKSRKPIQPGCDCPLCSRYSAGYLHHLMKHGEALFQRLATLHNLRFMASLTEELAVRGRRT